MSGDLTVGSTASGMILIGTPASSVLVDAPVALWMYKQLGERLGRRDTAERALAELDTARQEIEALRTSIARHKAAYTRAKRRRGRR